MTLSIQTDSDGNDHVIWAQRQANSCSIASIWMARSIAKQMTFDEGEWEMAHRLYGAAVNGISVHEPPVPPAVTWDSSQIAANQGTVANTFASNGVMAGQVADMLRAENMTVSHSANSGTAQSITVANLGTRTPAIVLVGWYGSGSRAGGHFIVAARVASNGRIVYLDPWGGRLNEVPNNAQYPGGGLVEEIVYITG